MKSSIYSAAFLPTPTRGRSSPTLRGRKARRTLLCWFYTTAKAVVRWMHLGAVAQQVDSWGLKTRVYLGSCILFVFHR
jgi:hypothetical protein